MYFPPRASEPLGACEVSIIETKPRTSRSLADLKQSLQATEGNEGDCDMT